MANPSCPIFLLFFLLSCAVSAQVPTSEIFSYTNSGEFGPYSAEYGADYRVLPIAASPFQLCFFNTTPGAFYLALRMGTRRSESVFRFVWTANPSRPVGENAVFSLLSNGDLRLTEADGSLVFSSGTAGKGVAALRLLPNGNILLVNSQGRSLWQSFEHPTDTLLVGQSLPVNSRLVSRLGTYSLAVEPGGLALYFNKAASGKPLLYSTADGIMRIAGNGLKSVTFRADPQVEKENAAPYAYELGFSLEPQLGTIITGRPKYNATLSFLRVEEDGNLVVYTYYDPVDYRAWERVFAVFSDEIGWEATCRLPAACGSMGVCERQMCVACPRPGGLMGWDEECAPPSSSKAAVERCHKGENASYFEVVGVETFLSRYGKAVDGVNGVAECVNRCSKDCSCLGFLYWEKETKCWLAPVIGSLDKVHNSTHVAWIKYYK